MSREALRGLFVALTLVVMTGLFAVFAASPAQAVDHDGDGVDDTKYGYVKVAEPNEYLPRLNAFTAKVLHIEMGRPGPAGASADTGFWVALTSNDARGFEWGWQKYGKWCALADGMAIQWNVWLNRYGCVQDDVRLEALYPGWTNRLEACRANSQQSWKQPVGDTGDQCSNFRLLPSDVDRTIQTDVGDTTWCAAWETRTLNNATGVSSCNAGLPAYSWANGGQKPVVQAPDTCVGLPSDYNAVNYTRAQVDAILPAVGDGTCTGETLAPNCTAEMSGLRACGGTPPVTAVATKTATATASADVVVSKTASRTVRYSKRVRLSKVVRIKGKQRRVSVDVTRRTSRVVTRTASVTQTGTSTATASRTTNCTRATQDEAQACADTAAQALADDTAQTTATAEATANARAAGATAAQDKANAAVAEAVRTSPVLAQWRKDFSAKVTRAARALLAKKIRSLNRHS